MSQERDLQALNHATHEKTCTCKGGHFSQEKCSSFKIGWDAALEWKRKQELGCTCEYIPGDEPECPTHKREV